MTGKVKDFKDSQGPITVQRFIEFKSSTKHRKSKLGD